VGLISSRLGGGCVGNLQRIDGVRVKTQRRACLPELEQTSERRLFKLFNKFNWLFIIGCWSVFLSSEEVFDTVTGLLKGMSGGDPALFDATAGRLETFSHRMTGGFEGPAHDVDSAFFAGLCSNRLLRGAGLRCGVLGALCKGGGADWSCQEKKSEA
jgi:hypothetical protein